MKVTVRVKPKPPDSRKARRERMLKYAAWARRRSDEVMADLRKSVPHEIR